MKVSVLTADHSHVLKVRAEWPLGVLAQRGDIELKMVDEPHDVWPCDVLVLIRRVDVLQLIDDAHAMGTKVVLDLDDDLFHLDIHNPIYLVWGTDERVITEHWKIAREYPHMVPGLGPLLQLPPQEVVRQAQERRRNLQKTLSRVDLVTVTTRALQKVYKPYNKNVKILPNQVLWSLWNIPREPHDGVWATWAGSLTHYDDLEIVAKSLSIAMDKCPQLRLVTIGVPEAQTTVFRGCPQDRITSHKWQDFERYQKVLAQADIILAPLKDTQFNHGKSDLRVLEGLVATSGKAAVLGSPTAYMDIIRQPSSGLVCKTVLEWEVGLIHYAKDETARLVDGACGYEYVKRHRTYEGNADLWLKTYQE